MEVEVDPRIKWKSAITQLKSDLEAGHLPGIRKDSETPGKLIFDMNLGAFDIEGRMAIQSTLGSDEEVFVIQRNDETYKTILKRGATDAEQLLAHREKVGEILRVPFGNRILSSEERVKWESMVKELFAEGWIVGGPDIFDYSESGRILAKFLNKGIPE
jgi:hypothetical protein